MIKMEREPLNAMVLYNEETGRKIVITAHGNDYLARFGTFKSRLINLERSKYV